MFGKRYEYDDAEFKRLLYLVENKIAAPIEMFAIITFPFLLRVPYFPKNSLTCTTELRLKFQDIVAEHHASFDANNVRDFIDAYIKEMNGNKEHGQKTHLSDIELLAVLDDFFLAGTETTSTTLRWAILYMIAFPEVQRKVHEEIDKVVGRNCLPKLADKINLPYTNAVIHEVQRFASIVHIIAPRCTNNDVNFNGFTIPKKSTVLCNLYSTTRDSSVWQDPDDFKPERFLDESGMFVKVQELIVFGAGMCLELFFVCLFVCLFCFVFLFLFFVFCFVFFLCFALHRFCFCLFVCFVVIVFVLFVCCLLSFFLKTFGIIVTNIHGCFDDKNKCCSIYINAASYTIKKNSRITYCGGKIQ